jgi:hypothetical protein
MGRSLKEENTVDQKLGYCTPVYKTKFFVKAKIKEWNYDNPYKAVP